MEFSLCANCIRSLHLWPTSVHNKRCQSLNGERPLSQLIAYHQVMTLTFGVWVQIPRIYSCCMTRIEPRDPRGLPRNPWRLSVGKKWLRVGLSVWGLEDILLCGLLWSRHPSIVLKAPPRETWWSRVLAFQTKEKEQIIVPMRQVINSPKLSYRLMISITSQFMHTWHWNIYHNNTSKTIPASKMYCISYDY